MESCVLVVLSTLGMLEEGAGYCWPTQRQMSLAFAAHTGEEWMCIHLTRAELIRRGVVIYDAVPT